MSFSYAIRLFDLYVPTKNYQVISTEWELWLHKISRGIKYIMKKVRVLLNTTCLLVFIYAYQILSKYFKPNTQEFGLEIHSGKLENNHSRGFPTCMQPAYCSKSMPLQNIIKIFQTIKRSLGEQDFGLGIYSVECKIKRTKQESSFLHVTLLLDLIYVPSKYYQIISDSM